MYKYRSREKRCVRFVFPNGRVVNLLGTDVNITVRETSKQPSMVKSIKGASDSDFEEILNNPRYKSLHDRITKIPEPKKPAKVVKKKKPKEKKSDVSDSIKIEHKSDSE